MTPQLWRSVENLFRAALALDGPLRNAFLERAERTTPEAVAEVRRLLEHDRAASRDWDGLDFGAALGTPDQGRVAAGPMALTLAVTDGPHTGASFTFHEHELFVVGRSENAHFRLPAKDQTLSRYQFLVEVSPPDCRLVDMGSTNGTKVNGKRVGTADLSDGDVVKAGMTTFRVSLTRREGPGPTADDELSLVDRIGGIGGIVHDREAVPEVPGYRILRRTGQGSIGIVYQARAIGGDAGAIVAIKVLTPSARRSGEALASFLREAGRLRELSHPGIVGMHELGESAGRPYFVMDHVEGVDGRSLVAMQGPLSVGLAVRLTVQVLEALDYAHGRGFVHRDVRPSNVLLTGPADRPAVRLTDFGLTCAYERSNLSGLTRTGPVAGSCDFMPPEQVLDFRSANPPADQYAAGATLYYLLTGATVHDPPSSTHGQLATLLTRPPIPIRTRRPDLDETLSQVIHRALERAPEHRYPSAADMLRALGPWLDQP